MGGFSDIGEAIDPSKLQQRYYSDPLNAQQNLTVGQLGLDRTANNADLTTFQNALKGSINQVNQLAPGDTAAYSGMLGSLSNPDALSLYRGVGDYRTGLLNQFSKNLADQGSASDKLAQARLGYGGRGPSTYQSNALIDRISKNLVPAFQSTIGSIGADTSSLQANQRANFDQAGNIIDRRAQIPLRSTLLSLLPIQARQQVTANEIGNEGQLGSDFRNNSAGFQLVPSIGSRVGSGLDGAVSVAGSLYSGGMVNNLGGGGGGMTSSGLMNLMKMFGGFGGTGGGSAPVTSNYQPASFGPSNFSQYGVGLGG